MARVAFTFSRGDQKASSMLTWRAASSFIIPPGGIIEQNGLTPPGMAQGAIE
jgi:hypothetical protein